MMVIIGGIGSSWSGAGERRDNGGHQMVAASHNDLGLSSVGFLTAVPCDDPVRRTESPPGQLVEREASRKQHGRQCFASQS